MSCRRGLLQLGLFTRLCFVSRRCSALWLAVAASRRCSRDAGCSRARPVRSAATQFAFLLYLAAAGPGTWSLDRLRGGAQVLRHARWAPYALGTLRIVAGFLFLHHGLEKVFGGRVPLDPVSLRAFAALLENVGGPLLMLGLFTRPLAFLLSGEMAFAYFINHSPDGFWASFIEPNQEAAILNCFLFLFLWGAGPRLERAPIGRRSATGLCQWGYNDSPCIESCASRRVILLLPATTGRRAALAAPPATPRRRAAGVTVEAASPALSQVRSP